MPAVKRAERNLNVELLRIIAMLLIVLGHCIGHNHLAETFGGGVRYVLKFIQIVSLPATNCFVLVTGYYQSQSNFKFRKLLLLWLQLLFYSIVLYGICVGFLGEPFRPIELLKALLPVSGNQYWFLRVFLGLYVLSPFLNGLAKTLEQKQFQKLLVINFVLFSLWRTFIPFAVTLNSEGGNSLIWFVVLYLTGAYLAQYPPQLSRRSIAMALLGFIGIAFTGWLALDLFSNRLGLNGKGTSLLTEFTAFPIYGSAICALLLVAKAGESSASNLIRHLITTISSSMLGIYMLHENSHVKQVLWPWLNLPGLTTARLLPTILVATILIFIAGVVVDQLTWQMLARGAKKVFVLINR